MKRNLLLSLFVILGVLFRFLPHPPNFTPLSSLSLFGATQFNNKYLGIILPIIVMGISDIFLGFYSISVWVYVSFILIGLLGTLFKRINYKNILLSSIIFFILTNFGVWLNGYPKTIEGFILCYTMAIPFFGYSLLGNFFFGYLFQYSWDYIQQKIPQHYLT